jgi:hypothetical protein
VPYGVREPTSSSPQPHWKAATGTPKAAPTHNRLVTAAWTGISSERKAMSSSTMLSASTTRISSASLEEILLARSTLAAVTPPT